MLFSFKQSEGGGIGTVMTTSHLRHKYFVLYYAPPVAKSQRLGILTIQLSILFSSYYRA